MCFPKSKIRIVVVGRNFSSPPLIANRSVTYPILFDVKQLKDVFPCIRENGYSKAFINVIKMASKANCQWINLDYNGDFVEDLGFCDW